MTRRLPPAALCGRLPDGAAPAVQRHAAIGAAAMQQASGMTAAALCSDDLPYATQCSWMTTADGVAVRVCCAQRAGVSAGRDQRVDLAHYACAPCRSTSVTTQRAPERRGLDLGRVLRPGCCQCSACISPACSRQQLNGGTG